PLLVARRRGEMAKREGSVLRRIPKLRGFELKLHVGEISRNVKGLLKLPRAQERFERFLFFSLRVGLEALAEKLPALGLCLRRSLCARVSAIGEGVSRRGHGGEENGRNETSNRLRHVRLVLGLEGQTLAFFLGLVRRAAGLVRLGDCCRFRGRCRRLGSC